MTDNVIILWSSLNQGGRSSFGKRILMDGKDDFGTLSLVFTSALLLNRKATVRTVGSGGAHDDRE